MAQVPRDNASTRSEAHETKQRVEGVGWSNRYGMLAFGRKLTGN